MIVGTSLPLLLFSYICSGSALPSFRTADVTHKSEVHQRAKRDPVWIAALNDDHAHMVPFQKGHSECPVDKREGCVGGYANIVGVVDHLRKREEMKNLLWLNAGDQSLGTAMFKRYQQGVIPDFDKIGRFDAVVPGNHDWDLGEEVLRDTVTKTKELNWLAANVEFGVKELQPMFKPYQIYPDKKVILMGLTTPQSVKPGKTDENTKIFDPVTTARKILREMKAELGKRDDGDQFAIGALTHIGYQNDIALAAAMEGEGLDFIVGGHSHTGLGNIVGQNRPQFGQGTRSGELPTKEGDTCIITSGYKGRFIAMMKLTWDDNNKLECQARGIEVKYNKDLVNEELQKIIDDKFTSKDPETGLSIEERSGMVIGATKGKILDQPGRYDGESLMGNFMADALLWHASENKKDYNPKFAFLTAGTLRTSLNKGDIVDTDIDVVQPFPDHTINWRMPKKDLHKVVAATYATDPALLDEVFLQYSHGVRVEYDPSEEPDKRLKSFKINGEELDKHSDDEIDFVTISWAMKMESILNVKEEKFMDMEGIDVGLLSDAIKRYVQSEKEVDIKYEGRVWNTKEDGDFPSDSDEEAYFKAKAEELGVYQDDDLDVNPLYEHDRDLLDKEEIFGPDYARYIKIRALTLDG
ncbi:Uu.00g085610.m01.CDS01 [Anthostomella pinea]|uniref:Uu.00g085610.m01.CDS01 n=1 Tax=Anthostomella pinea TaxID=933095 RepID=A0AAI8VN56_9PEZI|nr:Uu.00g085610.m01.CDS01 [Anthostomella pinea]